MPIVLQIITALGTIVAACSIVAAFALYRVQKRDEYLGTVRYSLQYLQNGMEELNSLLNFELAFEIASSAVFSIESQPCWKNIHRICNNAIKEDKDKDETQKAIKRCLGLFAFSLQTNLVVEYNKIIATIMQKSTAFHPEFQGLYRLSRACSLLMRNVLNNYIVASTNEEILSEMIYDQIVEKKLVIDSYDDFQKELLDQYISMLETVRFEHHQKDVDCVLEIVDIIYNAHILLPSRELYNVAKKTKRLKLEDSKNIKTITGELREAEKCFRIVISRDDSMKYASLVQRLEDANLRDD